MNETIINYRMELRTKFQREPTIANDSCDPKLKLLSHTCTDDIAMFSSPITFLIIRMSSSLITPAIIPLRNL